MTKLMKKKYLILIIVIILICNLGWYSIITIKYDKFIKNIPKNEWGLHFVVKEDGYMYSVKKPDYLSVTGNLAVANNEKGEHLIIWPLISGGYKYGFRLQKEDIAYEIYVNENMDAVYENNTLDVEKVEEYKKELEELFAKANEMWDLD